MLVDNPKQPIKGRGASDNPRNRFERLEYVPEGETAGENPLRPETLLFRDASRTAITYNKSPDIPYTASLNPYRGCEHGCSYCYARPYHEYLGFSAGLDFETRIMVKENLPALLNRELSAPRWQPQVLNLSGVTDPYQPLERQLQLTRRCLEVLVKFRNPVTVVTKNALVTRDVDQLSQLARSQCALVILSITSLENELVNTLEPRTSRPAQRLEAIRKLRLAGIPVGVLVAPVIPGLNDHEIPAILAAVAAAGAQFADYTLLRLPRGVEDIFSRWLEQHYPGRKKKVLNRLRESRSGNLSDSRFGRRMRGQGIFAEQIASLFRIARKRAKLGRKAPVLSTTAFQRPGGEQLQLL